MEDGCKFIYAMVGENYDGVQGEHRVGRNENIAFRRFGILGFREKASKIIGHEQQASMKVAQQVDSEGSEVG